HPHIPRDSCRFACGMLYPPDAGPLVPSSSSRGRNESSGSGENFGDAEVARIHAEEEIQAMIDSLDKSNETVAKYLQEYQQFALELSLEKKIELISNLVKYQDHYKKVYKFQSQQRKPMSRKQNREYYMAVIKSYLGWRFKDFKAQIQEKDTVILKLKEKIKSSTADDKERKEKVLVITALKEQLKGKAVLPKAVSLNPIDPARLQVDVVPLVLKFRKNRTAHIDYIKHTLEEAATLRELVKSERLLSPLNTPLAYACKYIRRIQELLMILQQTCPRITDLGTKLVAVTPKNQNKQVRCTPQITKSEKTSVDTSPSPNIDSNTPVLSSTRVALVFSASGSQSKDNTKNNRIRQTLKKAKKTELEDHPRKVKSILNKASVVDSRASSSVIKSVSNVNSNLKCASCNECLFSDNHDACVIEYINSVNVSRKSKFAKKPVKRKVWKTTGKVFKTVGYKWKPT
nr:hypothetical protein [Tanacetum cinerariifolium]